MEARAAARADRSCRVSITPDWRWRTLPGSARGAAMFLKARPSTPTRLALLGAVMAGLLLALALAASPQLHELLHHDGDRQEHVCLATILQAGGFEDVLVVIMAVEPMTEVIATAPLCDVEEAESFFLSCRVLEHAPPFVS